MEINTQDMILITEYEAIKKEIENLREWYFYEPKHAIVNAVYYEFMEKTNAPNLTAKEKLNMAESYFAEVIEYLKHFYPVVRPEIDAPILEKSISAKRYNKKQGKKKKHKLWRK